MSTRWQMLPGGLLEESGGRRSTRDWIVDATMLVLALSVGGIALAGTEARHTDDMVFVDLLIGLATLVPLWWRRRYPFAVALLTIIPGAFSAFAAGRGPDRPVQRRAARLPSRDRGLHRPRGAGGHRLRGALPRPGDRGRVRHLARGAVPGRDRAVGSVRAHAAQPAALVARARASSWRPSSTRGSSRRARPSGAGSPARCTTCSRTGCRCFRCTRARSSSTRTRRRRRSPRPRA